MKGWNPVSFGKSEVNQVQVPEFINMGISIKYFIRAVTDILKKGKNEDKNDQYA